MLNALLIAVVVRVCPISQEGQGPISLVLPCYILRIACTKHTIMNTRKALAFVLCTAAVITSGGLFKVLHWPGANIQLLLGGTLHIIALFALAVQVMCGGALGGESKAVRG